MVPYPHDAYTHSSVSGRVQDAATSRPISGIPISLAGETTFSGADGSFSFKVEKQRRLLVVIPFVPIDPAFLCHDQLRINGFSAGGKRNDAYRSMSVDVRSCQYSPLVGQNDYLKDVSLRDDVGTVNLVEDSLPNASAREYPGP